jgi:hypothetical protein
MPFQFRGESVPIDKREIDAILKKAWGIAVSRNPMLMAKLRPDYDFTLLHELIRDCVHKGLTPDETCEHVVKELVKTAISYTQPTDDCGSAGGREPQPVS